MFTPTIFVCGASGSGKSTSLRNLNPETTIIISTEREPLPFPDARKFKKQKHVPTMKAFRMVLKKALESDAEVIIIDSFTSLSEFMYKAVVRGAEKRGDGSFEAWAQYRDKLHDILLEVKDTGKIVVFLGIDDVIVDDKGRKSKTVAVQGSLKSKVEKEFSICLWTKVLDADVIEERKRSYVFVTNSDGACQAKSPLGMFDDLHIDNDLNVVIERVKEYYKD